MSTQTKEDRLARLLAYKLELRHKLIFQWVKTGVINTSEFKELIQYVYNI